MFTYVLLGIAALSVTGQNISKQKFNQCCNGNTLFFTGMISVFAMLFFIAINRDFYYSPKLFIPSAAFALSYGTATFGAVQAIRHGSLAKTSLLVSFSLLIPSLYGILFLHEPISASWAIGTVLLILSFVMINYEKTMFEEKSSWKWYFYVFLAFLGNGLCSTVQKAKQQIYGEAGNNLFMIVALFMVAVMMFWAGLATKENRSTVRNTVKHGFPWALLCGVANGLTNYLVICLNPKFPASTLFPVISTGNVILSFAYSIVVIREKFSPRQIIGFFIGIFSIVLLNL